MIVGNSLIDRSPRHLGAGKKHERGDVVFIQVNGFLKGFFRFRRVLIAHFYLPQKNVKGTVRGAHSRYLLLDALQGLGRLLALEIYIYKSGKGVGGVGIQSESLE